MASRRSEEVAAEIERIRSVIASAGVEGVRLQAVMSGLRPSLPEYTLQRRIARMLADGLIERRGVKRATTYFVSSPALVGQMVEARPEPYIPISPAAVRAKASVRRHIHERKPVGYERDFLDRYQPNITWYLPEQLRAKLAEMGSSAVVEKPAGTYARQIMQRLLIDLSWNSSRLEGNTYSLLETEKLLAQGVAATGKKANETQMIMNHKDAIEFLVESAEEVDFNRYTILNLHALLSRNLLGDPSAEGRLRAIAVGIGGTTYSPQNVPQIIADCFAVILRKASAIMDPFEQSFFVMVHVPYLQPFEDANKRVSRLAANLPFIKRNLSPLSFVDLPEQAYIDGILAVYELQDISLLRDVFAWAYERSAGRYGVVRQTLGEPDPFRLKYRIAIFDTVAEIVRRSIAKNEATLLIRLRAEALPEDDRARFVEVVEQELLALHDGNIARYRLRPSEFTRWASIWLGS